MKPKPPSMSGDLPDAVLAMLAHATNAKRCCFACVDAASPDGIQSMVLIAIDQGLFSSIIAPALEAAGVEVLMIKRGGKEKT